MIKDIQDIILDLIKFLPTLLWFMAVIFLITFIGYTIFDTYGYKISFILIVALLFIIYAYLYHNGYSIKSLKSYTLELVVSVAILSVVGFFLELTFKGDDLIRHSVNARISKKSKLSNLDNRKSMKKYNTLTIKEKIFMLQSLGLSQKEIKHKLANNMEFRQLMSKNKNSIEEILSN